MVDTPACGLTACNIFNSSKFLAANMKNLHFLVKYIVWNRLTKWYKVTDTFEAKERLSNSFQGWFYLSSLLELFSCWRDVLAYSATAALVKHSCVSQCITHLWERDIHWFVLKRKKWEHKQSGLRGRWQKIEFRLRGSEMHMGQAWGE